VILCIYIGYVSITCCISQRMGNQQLHHCNLILEFLTKTIADHIASFKLYLKVHNEQVEQRKKRVTRYGQGVDQLRANMSDTSKYAMFSSSLHPAAASNSTGTLELRNRRGASASDTSTMNCSGTTTPLDGKLSDRDEEKDYKLYKPSRYSKGGGSMIGSGLASMNSDNSYSVFSAQQQATTPKQDSQNRFQNAQKVEASIMQVLVNVLSRMC
jgi:hypothetical protein